MSTGILDELEAAVDKVAAAEFVGPYGPSILAIDQVLNRLEAQRSRLLGAFDATIEHTILGAKTATAWYARETRREVEEARLHVLAARTLRNTDTTRTAWENGEISGVCARQIARAKRAADADPFFNEFEDSLCNVAKHGTRKHVGNSIRRWREALDDHLNRDGQASEKDRERDNRHAHFSRSSGGVGYLNAGFENGGAEIASQALRKAMEQERRAGDDRTLPQLRADAIVRIFEEWLGGQGGDSNLPHILIVTNPQTYTGGPGAHAEYASGYAADTADVQRYACHANIQILHLDDEGVPLNLGRTQRLFTSHQYRAMVARDGGCRGPDCNAPADECHAHHRGDWANGTPTDLNHGFLLCKGNCHRGIHDQGWEVRGEINGTLQYYDKKGRLIGTSTPRNPSTHQPHLHE